MIYSIIGLPGAGKTLSATYLAMKQIKNGGLVCANYRIAGCLYTADPEELIYWLVSGDPRSPDYRPKLGIIDEANNIFNARDWDKLDPQVRQQLSQHRKAGLATNLLFTTQSFDFVDKYFRQLSNVVYIVHRYIFGITVLTGYSPNSLSPTNQFESKPSHRPLHRIIFKIKPELYQSFDTFEQIEIPDKFKHQSSIIGSEKCSTQLGYQFRSIVQVPPLLKEECPESWKSTQWAKFNGIFTRAQSTLLRIIGKSSTN